MCTTLNVDLMTSSSHKHSKVMIQFMEQQPQMSTKTNENPTKVELEDYLHEPCIDRLRDNSLESWCKIEFNKYPCISVLAKEFLSICASSSHSECLFSLGRRIFTFRRGRLAPDTISSLMTLKS